MVALITLDQAKGDLGVLDDDHNADITLKIEMASDIVMGYIEKDAAELGWDAASAPARIRAAAILVLRGLFFGETDPLSEAVKAVLRRDRDPAIA
ncbi:phage head-tail connector protein [Sphingobium sp. JS3065]|uniref:phage head-tail connector protein n=1 Tax=Sphingobium sp. JS3065 TaxID=2970925 RepID=UPI0022643488|nr:phage head-tail connector protein [Sphingobium sp. JS3065]UZW54962.1 phage head-tail connector protein [Sphingobium sp. JS3065]